MHAFSFGELALIFGIILILFGGSRLASVGRSLGEGIANFKKGLNSTAEESSQNSAASRSTSVPPALLKDPSSHLASAPQPAQHEAPHKSSSV